MTRAACAGGVVVPAFYRGSTCGAAMHLAGRSGVRAAGCCVGVWGLAVSEHHTRTHVSVAVALCPRPQCHRYTPCFHAHSALDSHVHRATIVLACDAHSTA